MDPDKNPSTPPNQEMNTATLNDLHNEGVDVLNGSGIAEENEFSDTETPKTAPQETLPIPPQTDHIQPAPQPPQPIEKSAQNDPSIKALRTFKSDAEEAVRYQNISTAKIAIAEQQKREATTPIQYEKEKKSPSVFILVLFMLMLIAGGGYYWFFMRTTIPASNIPQELKVTMLIGYAKADIVDIRPDTKPLISIASKLAVPPVSTGDIYTVIPVPMGTTTVMSSASSLFRNTVVPPMLDRSLSNTYMVGTWVNATNSPFIILKNTFFQNAFAGMLAWEKDMRNDFIPLIKLSHPQEDAAGTRTDNFEDLVVSNTDVRLLRNAAGEVILAYAFVDKDTLVITTGTETLSFIISKLLAVRIVQ